MRLSVESRFLEYDGGLKTIFAADGVDIESGHRFSEVVSNTNGSEVTTIQFAQYDNGLSPFRFSLARQSSYADNTEYIWRIPLLKNPSTAYIGLRYNLTLYESAGTNYETIFNHYEILSDYYTEPDTSTSFTTAVTNTVRNVQVTSKVDLSIDLGGTVVAKYDSVTFKLDNSLKGLDPPSFSNGNDTSNYDYYYFHTLEMIIAQKKTVSANTNVGINALSSALDYQSTFAFKWVKILDTSNTK